MRKEINSAREDFIDIVRDIDGNLDHLEWRDSVIPVPHFTDTVCAHVTYEYVAHYIYSECDSDHCLLIFLMLFFIVHQDGLFLPHKPSKPGRDVLRSFPQPPARPSEKRGVHSPEKLEAERDVSSSQISLSRECSSSSPARGGDSGSGQGDEIKDGEGVVIGCTGDTTTVWSSLGLDVGHSHSHLGMYMYVF